MRDLNEMIQEIMEKESAKDLPRSERLVATPCGPVSTSAMFGYGDPGDEIDYDGPDPGKEIEDLKDKIALLETEIDMLKSAKGLNAKDVVVFTGEFDESSLMEVSKRFPGSIIMCVPAGQTINSYSDDELRQVGLQKVNKQKGLSAYDANLLKHC